MFSAVVSKVSTVRKKGGKKKLRERRSGRPSAHGDTDRRTEEK